MQILKTHGIKSAYSLVGSKKLKATLFSAIACQRVAVGCANKDLRLFQQSSGDFRSVTRDF